MNWLITGGCGFVGANLIRSLLTDGRHAIRVVDDLSAAGLDNLREIGDVAVVQTGSGARLGPFPARGVEVVAGDITDPALAAAAVDGAEIVVHLAGQTSLDFALTDPIADCRINVLGTLTYLDAARRAGVARFIYPFSGAPSDRWLPPDTIGPMGPRPFSPNGASKLAGAGYCAAFAESYDLSTVALRFQNLYGPGSAHKGSVIAKFIRRALEGAVIEIYGDGQQTRDFLYIDDLVRAIRLAATADGIDGAMIEIATNVETTVGEVVDKIVGLLGRAGVCDLQVCHIGPRVQDVRRNTADLAPAETLLGWRPTVDLSEGLRRTVAWYLTRASVPSAAE